MKKGCKAHHYKSIENSAANANKNKTKKRNMKKNTKQNKRKQNKTRQDKTKQSKRKLNKTKHNKKQFQNLKVRTYLQVAAPRHGLSLERNPSLSGESMEHLNVRKYIIGIFSRIIIRILGMTLRYSN
jgi:ATP-dependent 26S proteasome regulatory subunit